MSRICVRWKPGASMKRNLKAERAGWRDRGLLRAWEEEESGIIFAASFLSPRGRLQTRAKTESSRFRPEKGKIWIKRISAIRWT